MHPALTPSTPCVRRVASVDRLLFAEATRRLDTDVASAGGRLQQELANLRAARTTRAGHTKLLASDAEATRCVWLARGADWALPGDKAAVMPGGTLPKKCTREGGELPRRPSRLDCSPGWEHATPQNFSSPRACFVGDQHVMETVWRQHANKKPVMDLLRVDPQVRSVTGGVWRYFRTLSRSKPTHSAHHGGDRIERSRQARHGAALAMLQHAAYARSSRNHTDRYSARANAFLHSLRQRGSGASPLSSPQAPARGASPT